MNLDTDAILFLYNRKSSVEKVLFLLSYDLM